jgi:16S rRNA (guanine(966)-N(2))-methyltransferase RsmD
MTARVRGVLPHEVRIVGGTLRRSKLPVPDVPDLRPTPDRVRETLFNWLGQDLAGWRCIDAFAGTGALGFEAASRGAASVLLLERDPLLVRSLEASRARLKAEAVRVEAADAIAWLRRAPPAIVELVFVDPPFQRQRFDEALAAAAPVVVAGGFIYLEADRAFDDARVAAHGLRVHRHGRAGAVHFHLLQRTEEPAGA